MMKTLYILNNPKLLLLCEKAMSANDSLILIEDAVVLSSKAIEKQSYVLEEDLIARGLSLITHSSWTLTNYQDFVDLSLAFDKSVTWL